MTPAGSPSRAYLPFGRLGDGLDALSAELARIDALFAAAGAVAVEPAALQPADLLLGLYGEDVRARAFVTHDPGEAELMLRPDFTVPVVRLHMGREGGATPARYRYAGPVWRRQAPGSARPTEFLQAGVEILGHPDAVAADAEIFALIAQALGPAGRAARARTGDLSVAFAAVAGLPGPERWKAALRRHFWRPAAFRATLEALGPGRPAPSPSRAALLAAAEAGEDALRAHVAARADLHGARPLADIMARARELAEDARLSLPPDRIAWLEAVLAVAGPADRALADLRALDEGGALCLALDRMARRLDALGARGWAAEALFFDASFGRALEYYDGFVFEFAAPDAPSLPPLGGGGRYDALTARLGAGAALPAVGGIVRPEAMLAALAAGDGPAAPDRPAAPAVAVREDGADDRIRLGLPSKGRLKDAAVAWFAARGLTVIQTAETREYAGRVEGAEGIDLVLLSAGEIPRELAAGRIHLGVTGEDMVRERIADADARVRLAAPLGFGHADLVLAVPDAWADVETTADLDAVAGRLRARLGRPLRIATKYHLLVRRCLQARGVADCLLVDSQGATEGTIRNGAAEAIADITSSGATLAANGLRRLCDAPILRSEATLCVATAARLSRTQSCRLAELSTILGVDLLASSRQRA